MPLDLMIQLAVLALIDATSIGTLLIPLWLLARTGTRRTTAMVLLYLGVLGTFYLGIGLLVLGGAGALLSPLLAGDVNWFEQPAPRWVAMFAGAGMLIWALVQRPAEKTAPVPAGAADAEGLPANARALKNEATWARRIGTTLGSPWGVVPLALLAGLLELPTMLPYLGAIGLLTAAEMAPAAAVLVLCLYCVVMVVPALVLVILKQLAGHRFDALLRKLTALVSKASGEALWWLVGIAGFLLMRWGADFLFPEAPWNPFK